MSDAPRAIQLTPAEWKQQCLFSVAQLHAFLESVPPQTEAGMSALSDDVMATIDAHLARGRSFLRAWQLSRVPSVVVERPVQAAAKTNGAHAPVKKKGGWPKGKSRKPRVEGAVQ